ncbi:endonuclease/exonuclease/phosphatase family protein [Streptomyces sp. NRRL F-2580]|uniref:endonuclease/exonuclease/phosphatase family protein n=1 Tax=Streptomyces sp. NRRL F-2580 TaxID=1463841 RepID=UPI0006911251|nr:endonuclease/exonuclease/phosphatase family protein [Streptomyces sp. NRRL F-2580]
MRRTPAALAVLVVTLTAAAFCLLLAPGPTATAAPAPATETRRAGTVRLTSYATLPAGNASICEGDAYGNAVLVRGPVSDTADLDLTVGGEREPITVPCALASLPDRPTWSCSVHLYWDDGTLAVPEADRLAEQARRWLDDGSAVVLGGDFNHSPRTATPSRFYLAERGDGAHGDFTESDESDPEFFDPAVCPPATTSACRSGETTFGAKKLDYLFFSAPHFRAASADALPLDTAVSDHNRLRVSATAN